MAHELESFASNARKLLAVSARSLGWTPDTFWNATPEELATCVGSEDETPAPLGRAQIAAMMERDKNG